jgi:phosphoesterase RecJ-like protein
MSDARQAILDIIREKHSFAIMTHREPDGDALGSSFALGRFLERIGKSVIYYAREPMPKTIGGFLPNYRGFENRLS